eukprot:CAMPEP_0180565340 /NCGR_PEP_ID=MMETSP1037_2-20121125/5492_1 /TAXON_ID=632150 /ORGANISM="Azadinium spinosum, Strain 3D9" /LENGTH=63 /DNA_ID=CAMNT_0022582301 /DNA_START=442 /DNA_END=630 /DNA_ORIENTATION=-
MAPEEVIPEKGAPKHIAHCCALPCRDRSDPETRIESRTLSLVAVLLLHTPLQAKPRPWLCPLN